MNILNSSHLRILSVILSFFLCASGTIAYAEKGSINSLLKIENTKIFSPSRVEEDPFNVAASIHILSANDIKRSGATNIAEVLRLVPGVEVYRSGSSKYSVTIRGFGRLYDNKVLVMIDGRELYSSVFTGTYWDIADVVMEDIERIEVIRGGTTTMWGANSLNGVINIITKNTQYTQGNYFSTLYGNQEQITDYRYGNHYNKNLFYRVWGKKINRDELKIRDSKRGDINSGAGDDWSMNKAGFRIDYNKSLKDEITIQGDIHDGKMNRLLYVPSFDRISDAEKSSGFNIDSKWKHQINEHDKFELHTYFDQLSRKSIADSISRKIFHTDLEYDIKLGNFNKLKLGVGYRHNKDDLKDGFIENVAINQYNPNKNSSNLYMGFIQDTISVIPNKVNVIVGSRYEHHHITGSNFMPSLKFKWSVNDNNVLWSSISKGARQPSLYESTLRRMSGHYQGIGYIHWQSNPNFKAEKMKSYQMGYRNRSFDRLEIDFSAFYNKYDDVRSLEKNLAKLQYEAHNKASARTHGFTVSGDVIILPDWQVFAGYSYLDMDMLYDEDSTDDSSIYDDEVSPVHQIHLQSRYNITRNIDFDINFFYTRKLLANYIPLKSYKRTDIRIAWRPIKDVELSLVGQKLFYGDTQETSRPWNETYNATYGNQVYGRIEWKF